MWFSIHYYVLSSGVLIPYTWKFAQSFLSLSNVYKSILLYSLLCWGSFRRHVDILVLSNFVRPYTSHIILLMLLKLFLIFFPLFMLVRYYILYHFLVNFFFVFAMFEKVVLLFFLRTDRLVGFLWVTSLNKHCRNIEWLKQIIFWFVFLYILQVFMSLDNGFSIMLSK